MIGFPDRGEPDSLSKAGTNVLVGGAGWTGWRRGLRAGSAGAGPCSWAATGRYAFAGGGDTECGGAMR